MTHKKYVFLGLLLFAACVLISLSAEFLSDEYCEIILDGTWATNGEYCQTSQCYYDGTCLSRVFPATQCPAVRIGDHISEVFAKLGEPMSDIDGQAALPDLARRHTYTWRWDKGGHGIGVIAEFRNETLISLSCPAFPGWRD